MRSSVMDAPRGMWSAQSSAQRSASTYKQKLFKKNTEKKLKTLETSGSSEEKCACSKKKKIQKCKKIKKNAIKNEKKRRERQRSQHEANGTGLHVFFSDATANRKAASIGAGREPGTLATPGAVLFFFHLANRSAPVARSNGPHKFLDKFKKIFFIITPVDAWETLSLSTLIY